MVCGYVKICPYFYEIHAEIFRGRNVMSNFPIVQ